MATSSHLSTTTPANSRHSSTTHSTPVPVTGVFSSGTPFAHKTTMKHPSSIIAALLLPASIAIAQPAYTIQDITNWTPQQLQTLPFFTSYVPTIPDTAPNGFVPAAHNQSAVIGSYKTHSNGTYGSIATPQINTFIYPLGEFYWARTWWDGKDIHFANGRVNIMNPFHINNQGTIVGTSTIAGSGEYSSEHSTHAVLCTTTNTTLTDLTPAAHRAAATAINNAGAITGWSHQEGVTASGFIRFPDATTTTITSPTGDVRPVAINDNNRIAGAMTSPDYWLSDVAFVAESTDTTATTLPLPSQNSPTDSAAYDMNNSIIVGATWRRVDNQEHYATIWENESEGAWIAHDLNELLDENPVDALLERALATNPQGYIIASGRPDGTDILGTRRYLLTPEGVSLCTPDLNEDNTLDFFDISLFLQLFADSDPLADFNNDSSFDFFDISAFLTAFSTGCP